MSRGSTWHIWDFHLHTPWSILNNEYGDPTQDSTWERYVDCVEKKARELGIAALGVTDYFMIEGYKRLCQLQSCGHLNGIMLFPNIEFRVDKVVYRSRGAEPRRLNVHVLFAPSVSAQDIEEHFLHDLRFIYQEEPYEHAQKFKLKISNLTTFGSNLRNQHDKFKEMPPLEVGCMNAIVRVDDIKETLLDSARFKGKYFIVLAEENLSLMDWDSQDHALRKQLIQMAHMVFSSNEASRDWYLGRRHPSLDAFIEEFKTQKPCIWGCDSHGYGQRFLEPDGKRYCWLKGEVSWEGLRQILYEPEERVRIQENEPEPAKSYYSLAGIRLEETCLTNSLSVSSTKIEFNPNLVAVIGGRGSGKTALLDAIGACFGEGRKLVDLESSFLSRLYGKAATKSGTRGRPLPTELEFKNGEVFTKRIGEDQCTFDKADILYLTQNHMEEYTSNPRRLNEHIIALVFDQLPEQVEGYAEIEQIVSVKKHEIQTINLQIEQLQAKIAGQRDVLSSHRKQLEGELADHTQRYADEEKRQQSSTSLVAELTERLRMLKARRVDLRTVADSLSALRARIDEFEQLYGTGVRQINDLLLSIGNLAAAALLPERVDSLQGIMSQLANISYTVASDLDQTTANIQSAESEVNQLEGASRVVADLRQKVDAISAEIRAIDQDIREVDAMEERLAELSRQRIVAFAELMQTIVIQRNYLQQVIELFEAGKDEILHSLSFAAFVDTEDQENYLHQIAERVDNRVHSQVVLRENVREILHRFIETLDGLDGFPVGQAMHKFTEIAEQIYVWASGLKRKSNISDSDYYNAVFSSFFDIGLKINFGSRPLQALSMGERAVVLLKILLALDDKPLLIDQPEEHLDNRYIFDELTPAFRCAKKKRQIIIATHNANLVVNTDAEQIIVAEHANGIISYRAGTLEDLECRDAIKTLLEGGDVAFKKREAKYGYMF